MWRFIELYSVLLFVGIMCKVNFIVCEVIVQIVWSGDLSVCRCAVLLPLCGQENYILRSTRVIVRRGDSTVSVFLVALSFSYIRYELLSFSFHSLSTEAFNWRAPCTILSSGLSRVTRSLYNALYFQRRASLLIILYTLIETCTMAI